MPTFHYKRLFISYTKGWQKNTKKRGKFEKRFERKKAKIGKMIRDPKEKKYNKSGAC